MNNILEKIVADKQLEVAEKKKTIPVEAFKDYPNYQLERRSLKASLLKEGSTGIIAEYKRRSPSKGVINATAQVEDVVKAYSKAAAAISVLTDEKYFGGTNDDLIAARKVATVPLLRKEFIVDEYQIHEARAIGADLILLIAACLTREQVKHFASVAKQLELEVLLEIHDETELVHICDEVDFVGVNNRNLKTFSVDINTSLRLFGSIPAEKPAIAESGISNTDAILTLREAGFKGFLIGENFMKENDPSFAFASFVESLTSGVKNA
jgi:indole-3-glycerol phosphate synthase